MAYSVSDICADGKATPVLVKIMNVRTGVWQLLDPVTRSVISINDSPQQVQAMIAEMDREESCPANLAKMPEAETMMGHATVYVEEWPTSDIKVEKWMAPDLGCFPLKEIETSAAHGGAYNVHIVTSLQPGEAGSALMQVPDGYTERRPSAVENVHQRKTGKVFLGPVASSTLEHKYSGGK